MIIVEHDEGGQAGSRDACPTSKEGEWRRRDRADWRPDPDRKPTTAKFCRKDEDETKVTRPWIQKKSNKRKRERVEREAFWILWILLFFCIGGLEFLNCDLQSKSPAWWLKGAQLLFRTSFGNILFNIIQITIKLVSRIMRWVISMKPSTFMRGQNCPPSIT